MTRKQLRWRLSAAFVVLVLLVTLAILLALHRMPELQTGDERTVYRLIKDLFPLVLGVLAVYSRVGISNVWPSLLRYARRGLI
jgi:hypothetical protein